MAGVVSKWLSRIDHALPVIIARLRIVQIEGLDASDIIPRYDSAETLFYCDPPYLPETRRDTEIYPYEMTIEQHRQLLQVLCSIKGMIVLSGYPSELYRSQLDGWERFEFNVSCHSAHKQGQPDSRRTETIWLNPAAMQARQGMLF